MSLIVINLLLHFVRPGTWGYSMTRYLRVRRCELVAGLAFLPNSLPSQQECVTVQLQSKLQKTVGIGDLRIVTRR